MQPDLWSGCTAVLRSVRVYGHVYTCPCLSPETPQNIGCTCVRQVGGRTTTATAPCCVVGTPECAQTRARGVIVVPSGATSDSIPVAVYGSSYPDASECAAAGLKPSTQAPLSIYTIPAGQAYVATAATDDYFSGTGTVLIGGRTMNTIQYNHRTALVYSNDVSAQSLGEGLH